MATAAGSHDADPGGIDAPDLRIADERCEGCAAVIELCGEDRGVTWPVPDRCHDVAVVDEPRHRTARSGPSLPLVARDPHDEREAATAAARRQMDVESLSRIVRCAIGLIAMHGRPLGGLWLKRRAQGGIDGDRQRWLRVGGWQRRLQPWRRLPVRSQGCLVVVAGAVTNWRLRLAFDRQPAAGGTPQRSAGGAAVGLWLSTCRDIGRRAWISGDHTIDHTQVCEASKACEQPGAERMRAESSTHDPPGSSRETAGSRRSPRVYLPTSGGPAAGPAGSARR